MTVFWSVLTVVVALSATEASAANWNDGRYPPVGIVDQLKRGAVSQQGVRVSEPAPIVLAEARKAGKRSASGLHAPVSTAAGASSSALGTVVTAAISVRGADHERGHHLRGGRRGQCSRTGLTQRRRDRERIVGSAIC